MIESPEGTPAQRPCTREYTISCGLDFVKPQFVGYKTALDTRVLTGMLRGQSWDRTTESESRLTSTRSNRALACQQMDGWLSG